MRTIREFTIRIECPEDTPQDLVDDTLQFLNHHAFPLQQAIDAVEEAMDRLPMENWTEVFDVAYDETYIPDGPTNDTGDSEAA